MPDDISAAKVRLVPGPLGRKVPLHEAGGDGPAMSRRPMRAVPTDTAGEWQGYCEDTDLISMATTAKAITRRHRDALHHLHRLYHDAKPPGRAASGFAPGRGHGEMSDKQAAAWKLYTRLLNMAPAETRHALAIAASGEWPVFANALALLREGATAVADHLRISR